MMEVVCHHAGCSARYLVWSRSDTTIVLWYSAFISHPKQLPSLHTSGREYLELTDPSYAAMIQLLVGAATFLRGA